MKLKKHLRLFFSFLLLSVFLLTGCSPLTEEPVAELPVITDESNITEEETLVSEEEIEIETETEEETQSLEEKIEEATKQETIETTEPPVTQEDTAIDFRSEIDENGTYTSKEEVAAYLNLYGHLPSNYITKKEAKKLGWVSSEGNLDEVAPGMSIGGDYFGNFEGNLPEAKGRDYYECDIDFDGSYRNAKRIVFSNDGLIYYTEDHYETFELLYGEE